MSMDMQAQMGALIAVPVVKLAEFSFITAIPVNPHGIVSIKDDGFVIDLDSMETMQPYRMDFLDSRYVIWKNRDGALVIEEV